MATSYIKDDDGGTFIPASQRPDGSWRKPRRVKDGYVPQEEVPLYESLGKQFQKSKRTYPPGVSAEYAAAQQAKVDAETKRSTIPGLIVGNDTKKKKKKSKSKSGTGAITEELAKTVISEPETPKQQSNNKVGSKVQAAKHAKTPQPSAPRQDGHTLLSDSMKRLKNLRKKIREIEGLEIKIKNGEIKNPEKEILDKISRKKEINEEIKLLESNQ